MTRQYPGTTSPEITERELNACKVARRAAAEGMVLLKNFGCSCYVSFFCNSNVVAADG